MLQLNEARDEIAAINDELGGTKGRIAARDKKIERLEAEIAKLKAAQSAPSPAT